MKYMRTMHMMTSPGLMNDDRRIVNYDHLKGKNVIITEKIDGECISFLTNKCHARSEMENKHQSRHWIRAKWGSVKHLIPDHIQIVVENAYAKHSIEYDALGSYGYVFSVIDLQQKKILSWKDTREWADKIDLPTVPVLYRGPFIENFECPEASYFGPMAEGYVLRYDGEIPVDDWDKLACKYVKKKFRDMLDASSQHWAQNWKPNTLVKS